MCDFCKDAGYDLPPCHKDIGNHRVAKTVKVPLKNKNPPEKKKPIKVPNAWPGLRG